MEVISLANRDERVVLTRDNDFLKLYLRKRAKYGIIYIGERSPLAVTSNCYGEWFITPYLPSTPQTPLHCFGTYGVGLGRRFSAVSFIYSSL